MNFSLYLHRENDFIIIVHIIWLTPPSASSKKIYQFRISNLQLTTQQRWKILLNKVSQHEIKNIPSDRLQTDCRSIFDDFAFLPSRYIPQQKIFSRLLPIFHPKLNPSPSLEKIFLRCCTISHLDFNIRSFEKDVKRIFVLLA